MFPEFSENELVHIVIVCCGAAIFSGLLAGSETPLVETSCLELSSEERNLLEAVQFTELEICPQQLSD